MSSSPKRILMVAGEASADRYGARLVEKLNTLHGSGALDFYGTGGDAMQNAGVRLLCNIRDLAHIGVREALSGIRTYYGVYTRLAKDAAAHPPDLAVLMDFPEFNLRLAKRLKRLGIKVIYYIGPQLWAWRSGRIRSIRDYVDILLVILPFEEEYYRSRGVNVEFVGHPLLEDFRPNYGRDLFLSGLDLDPRRKTVAMMAGSRRKEVDYILPVLLRAAQCLIAQMPVQFVVSAAPTVGADSVRAIARSLVPRNLLKDHFRISPRDSRDILANSDFAFVKSGTSSLEAALVGVPFLITYKISPLSWFVGSVLIQSPMKGLVNLIAQEKIVPELFQSEAKPAALAQVAFEYMNNPDKNADMRYRLSLIRDKLGARGATETVAATVSRYLMG